MAVQSTVRSLLELVSSTVRNGHGENLFTLDGHTINVTQPFNTRGGMLLSPLTLGGITVNVSHRFNVHAVTKKVLSRFAVVYEGKKWGFRSFGGFITAIRVMLL